MDLRQGVTVTAIDRAAATVSASGPAAPSHCPTTSCCWPPAPPRDGSTSPAPKPDEVLYLRTLADSDRLRAAFQPGTRVVVAGAGWIGLETAAAARYGWLPRHRASSREPAPLHAQVGPELGAVFADLHRAHGVEFRFGERAVEFRPGPARPRRLGHHLGRARS